LEPVREGLSHEGKLYALPFYAESSMTFYRTDLFEKAGIRMPEEPTWDQIKEFAAKVHDPNGGVYGICLRGKPGWGENMGFVSTLVNSFGGRWFDEDWRPQLDSGAWRDAISFYVDLLRNHGPPDAASNGFNENRALFAEGRCGIWVDATVAAGMLFDPERSKVVGKVGFAQAPTARTDKGSHWLWSWALAIPASSDGQDAALEFIAWATSKDYARLVAEEKGWVAAPAGTRASVMGSEEYRAAAPFAGFVQKAIETADPTDQTLEPAPYDGIQYVDIPEFQSIGTAVGQQVADALTGTTPVDEALDNAQWVTGKVIERARFLE
jgi:sorbitol/mannitol transport system substrate-binding protein